ncbi:hypothetical protein [Aquisphaera insulae]|uniref:hypothetical protein n=1 Tax=Aquisphaera insulae TaxID=2712864 RepID=UPI0013EB2722|nr:hypothetical protein [Aquisphaera insulae]
MCRRFVFEGLASFEGLEHRLSMSGLFAGVTDPKTPADEDPAPKPEPDPGPLPTDEPPILIPPLPPSGPVGPG